MPSNHVHYFDPIHSHHLSLASNHLTSRQQYQAVSLRPGLHLQACPATFLVDLRLVNLHHHHHLNHLTILLPSQVHNHRCLHRYLPLPQFQQLLLPLQRSLRRVHLYHQNLPRTQVCRLVYPANLQYHLRNLQQQPQVHRRQETLGTPIGLQQSKSVKMTQWRRPT